MNLLKIQDDLKNVSDQDLSMMLRSPSSAAPSYLVLSEIRRRKDMRTQAGDPPQTTVADDLTTPPQTYSDAEGIRSLRVPGYEEEQQVDEADSGAGIEAMRAGGIVRMADGGAVEYFNDDFGLSAPPPPQGNLITNFLGTQSPDQLREIIRRGTPSTGYGNRWGVSAGDAELARVAREMLTQREAASTQQAAPQTAQVDAGSPSLPLPLPPPSPPSGRAMRQPSAGGVPASASSVPGISDREVSMEDIMRRNMELIPAIPEELMNRLREGRTNEADRRREAQRNALIEAGLRIAASNNPRLAGAIGEGATPALQSYNQQIGEIRRDQRADLQQEFAVAQADIQRRYMAGQISAAEYRTATQENMANARLRAQLAQSAASQGASLAREELRHSQAMERAQEQERRQLMMSAAQEASRAMRDPEAVERIKQSIDIERRRANPTGTFTPVTNDQVENYIMSRIMRNFESARQNFGQQGSQVNAPAPRADFNFDLGTGLSPNR